MNKLRSAAAVAVLAMLAAAPAAVHAAEGTALSASDINSEGRIIISEPGSYYLSEDIIKSDTGFAIRNTATNGEVTLDLNGHTLTNGEEWTAIWNLAGCTMTITDSSQNTSGVINGNWNAINNYGTMMIKNGSFSGDNNGIYNEGTITIDSGSITGVYHALYCSGAYNDEDGYTGDISRTTIRGGTFNATYQDAWYAAVNVAGYADVTINDGIFNGYLCSLSTAETNGEPQKINISGGTFSKYLNLYSAGTNFDIDISGGNFNSGIYVYDPYNSSGIDITGGTFAATTSTFAEGTNSGTTLKGAIVLHDAKNVTMTGMTVNAKGEGIYGIAIVPSNLDYNSNTKITGGTISAEDYAVWHEALTANPKTHIIEISGGTLTGKGAHYATLSGSAVCGKSDKNDAFIIDWCDVTGGTFNDAILNGTTVYQNHNTITGGTFNLTGNKITGQWTITGGTFNYDVHGYAYHSSISNTTTYAIPTGYCVISNSNGTQIVQSTSDAVTEGTVLSAISESGTYEQMKVNTASFDTATEGVTYKVAFTGGDYDGQTKTVKHDFGTTITGSVIYGLIINGLPSDVTAVITVE